MSGPSPQDEAKVDDAALAHLGEVLRPVAEHCGLAAALAIVDALGGKTIYVPVRPRPGQKLVEAAGMEAAQAMAAAFGSEQVAIPSAALLRREGIKAAVARDNRPHGVVAHALGISHSWVKKLRRRQRRQQTAREPGLLDG